MLFQSCVTRDTNIGSNGSQFSSDYLLFYFTEENSFSEYYTTAQSKTPPIHSVSFMCLHGITMTTIMSWDFGSINSGSESICETHCLIIQFIIQLWTPAQWLIQSQDLEDGAKRRLSLKRWRRSALK